MQLIENAGIIFDNNTVLLRQLLDILIAAVMFSATSRSYLVGVSLLLLPLLVGGCLGSAQYMPTPGLRSGASSDIVNFSDSEIDSKKVN